MKDFRFEVKIVCPELFLFQLKSIACIFLLLLALLLTTDWYPRSSRLEAKTDAKRLALDEGVVGEESDLFFSGGKDDWGTFWETTLAIDQEKRESAWQEAILLLMR